MFESSGKIRKIYGVSPQTLRSWAKEGKINYRTIKHAKRSTWLYELQSIEDLVSREKFEPTKDKPTILYARVSSSKQKEDLKRQIEVLSREYPEGEIISDIGSGLNDNRPGFRKLVDRICNGSVSRVVVTYKDRITRFGIGLFKQICDVNGVKFVVFSKDNHLSDVDGLEEQELQEDLLSIVNGFVARRNGRRGGQLKKLRKEQARTDRDDPGSSVSDHSTEECVGKSVQCEPVGVEHSC